MKMKVLRLDGIEVIALRIRDLLLGSDLERCCLHGEDVSPILRLNVKIVALPREHLLFHDKVFGLLSNELLKETNATRQPMESIRRSVQDHPRRRAVLRIQLPLMSLLLPQTSLLLPRGGRLPV